jgi:MerR family transcriptional regulator, heat shock protein HspR
MADRRSGVYSISVIARLTGLHEQTIRQYERLGLLTPQRTPGGTRSFSEDDLERLRSIARLTREMGVNLAGVELILKLRERQDQLIALLGEVLGQLDPAARAQLEALLRGDEPGLVPVKPAGLARPDAVPAPPKPAPRQIPIKGK